MQKDTKRQNNPNKLLEFVPASAPILRQKCRRLAGTEIRSVEIQNLIDALIYTGEKSQRGVGLSANQVGRSEAISVVTIKATPARPNLAPFQKVYINTEIVETFGKKEPMWEGCLSTAQDKNGEPSMAQVPRYQKVRIKYYDRGGKVQDEILEGFVAQVLQHETDHLNGILFTDLIDQSSLIPYQEYLEKIVQR